MRRTGKSDPYGSYGNGSAMRVSPVAWVFDTIEEVNRFAKIQADVTHDHPEGERGACAIASAILLARKGKSKEEIKSYITRAFGYKLNTSANELRRIHSWNATCQDTVPQSIQAFLESNSFEDASAFRFPLVETVIQ